MMHVSSLGLSTYLCLVLESPLNSYRIVGTIVSQQLDQVPMDAFKKLGVICRERLKGCHFQQKLLVKWRILLLTLMTQAPCKTVV